MSVTQNTSTGQAIDQMAVLHARAALAAKVCAAIRGPFEPSSLALIPPADGEGLALLYAPFTLCAGDVCARELPSRVAPDQHLRICLALRADFPSACAEEASAALAWFDEHAVVTATLETAHLGIVVLAPSVTLNTVAATIELSIYVPADASPGSAVLIRCDSVPGAVLELRVPVIPGIMSPLTFEGVLGGDGIAPVITRAGTMYVPAYDRVFITEANGTQRADLDMFDLGLSHTVECAAFAEVSRVLVLADSTTLVAVDPATGALLWVKRGIVQSCHGLVVLEGHGVIFASSSFDRAVFVLRLVDGGLLCRFNVETQPRFLCVDPFTCKLYVSLCNSVRIFHWNTVSLVPCGFIPETGDGCLYTYRLVAVMPPAAGKHNSYLILVAKGTANLIVYDLSHLIKIAEILLPLADGELPCSMGIAADPWGCALAVCTMNGAGCQTSVMPWPLPDMPPLE